MVTLSIAVLDDTPNDLRHIADMARVYCEKEETGHQVTEFETPDAFWQAYATRPFDIAFIDIMLPGQSGLEVAKRLYTLNRHCLIIFITASPEFALHGYGMNAVSYLLKPVSATKFCAAMDACLERLGEKTRSLALKTENGLQRVHLFSILYCASENRRVHVFCDAETLIVPGKLDDLLALLPDYFARAHKRYAVNLHRMHGLKQTAFTADNGEDIPISRAYREKARTAWFAHVAAAGRE